MPEQEWFTSGEAAEYLRLSKPSIYRLVAEGVLQAHQIGSKGEWRFRRADLDAALKRVPRKPGPRPRRRREPTAQRTAIAA